MKTPANTKVLLIDNNLEDINTIKSLVTQASVPVCLKLADNFSEGLHLLSCEGADVIFLNLDLPDGQGLEGLDKIISSASNAKTIVLTDNDDFKFGAEVTKAGARDVLVKTQLDQESLLQSISLSSDAGMQSISAKNRTGIWPMAAGEVWLRTLIEKNADGLMILDKHGIIRFANPAAAKMFSKTIDQLCGALFGHPTLDGETTEIDIPNSSNLLVAELRTVAIDWQGEWATLVSLRDVTARKHRENKLKVLAGTDYLTGTDNRRSFMSRAQQEFVRARRYGHALSILMLDIDNFKLINDTYGHFAGNEVLKTLVRKSKTILRQTDIIGRLGGDEFCIIMVETSADGATLVANRLKTALSKTMVDCDGYIGDKVVTSQFTDSYGTRQTSKPLLRKPFNFTVSGGIATLAENDSSLDEFITRADEALYEAKRNGRNLIMQSLGGEVRSTTDKTHDNGTKQ